MPIQALNWFHHVSFGPTSIPWQMVYEPTYERSLSVGLTASNKNKEKKRKWEKSCIHHDERVCSSLNQGDTTETNDMSLPYWQSSIFLLNIRILWVST